MANSFPLKKILLAGLIAGSLDITAACLDAWLTFGTPPAAVLRGIAGGAIGKEQVTDEFQYLLLGLAIHFFIAYSYTFLFWFVYPGLKRLLKYDLFTGLVYGFFTWVSMRFIVLPVLSQVKFPPFNPVRALKAALILVAAIGIPLSLMFHKFTNESSKPPPGR